jgi:hypothetical protein
MFLREKQLWLWGLSFGWDGEECGFVGRVVFEGRGREGLTGRAIWGNLGWLMARWLDSVG